MRLYRQSPVTSLISLQKSIRDVHNPSHLKYMLIILSFCIQ